MSERSRVQTTSAPKAVIPESAMARCTAPAPVAGRASPGGLSAASGRCRAAAARASAARATAPFTASATYVAVGMSYTRKR